MIIAISGASGSGKTYLSEHIKNLPSIKKIEVISIDNYYKNKEKEKFENYDHPNAFDIQTLLNDIHIFINESRVVKRLYSFTSKNSNITGSVHNVDILILEGLYSYFYREFKHLVDLKVFLDMDIEKSMQRRIRRDKIEREIQEEENIKMINSFVLKMYYKFVTQQIKDADIVLRDLVDIDLIIDRVDEK
jgi:uridine kinase